MMKHLIASAMLLLLGSTFAAAELAAPQGRTILEVAGRIGVGNAKDAEGNLVARFDLAGLMQLPQTTIETRTEWTEGMQVFEGVLLGELLKLVDASGDSIRAVALNDFNAAIPMSDVDTYGVLLALRQNGELMRVRDKGPIWIVYPWNESTADVISSINWRMVWQLSQLVIE
jgi:hypothetical protein